MYWKLFLSFLKIGLFTFGGGYAMIPLIQREVIDRNGWLDREHFLELLALAQSAPGPIALNAAVFVGYKAGGYRGALAAVLGTILPSFAVILSIAMFFSGMRHNPVVDAAFKGMRPAVVALIAAPLIGLSKGMNLWKILIAIAAATVVWLLGVSPIWLILAGMVGGIGWTVWKNVKKVSR